MSKMQQKWFQKINMAKTVPKYFFHKLCLDLQLQFNMAGKHENTELSKDRKETKPRTE